MTVPPRRYDHYSVLCELLPVGIPSLAICLQTLVTGEPPPPRCQPHLPTPQRDPILQGRVLGGGKQGKDGFSSPGFAGGVAPSAPLFALPRGIQGRDKGKGPGCAGF